MMRIGFNDYKEIKEYYDKGLNVDKKLVKTTNDEPTPITCVEEMVERIPEDFWKRDGLKILDPCCGCGNFPFVIYYKLIKYHSRETILKDILHFNDLNMERIEVLKNIFDYEGLNVYTEDFLNFKTDIRFDLIVANPPYAKLDVNGKRTAKNHNLIGLFISKSLDLLLDKGLLLYITPDNWMSYADRNTLIIRLTRLQIVHINIHTAKKYFPKVGSSFVWYLIENTESYKDITVEGKWKGEIYKSSVKSEERRYIPLYYNKRVQSILKKTLDNKRLKKFEVETTSYLHKYTKKEYIRKDKDEEHIYKLIHTPKQVVWSSKKHKYQDGWKVFISTTSYYGTFVDNCGMTQSIAFIRCKDLEEANKINKVLSHPLYKFVNDICRYGNFNNIRILQSFPYIDDYDKVYKKFKITKKEQDFIESKITGFSLPET
jgi:methylase of polypeptide subunit release factors